jgi:hypothetical protein
MTTSQFAKMCFLLLAFCFISTVSLANQPNLVLILTDDIGEQNDVADDHPETVKRLFDEYRNFAKNRKLKQAPN